MHRAEQSGTYDGTGTPAAPIGERQPTTRSDPVPLGSGQAARRLLRSSDSASSSLINA
jgi:hypothetical protein